MIPYSTMADLYAYMSNLTLNIEYVNRVFIFRSCQVQNKTVSGIGVNTAHEQEGGRKRK